MSGAPAEQVESLLGARVSDLFDPNVGTDREADPLDLVLHDLAGVILRKPVYKMMGAKGTAMLDIYSGAIYMDDLIPTDRPRGVEFRQRLRSSHGNGADGAPGANCPAMRAAVSHPRLCGP